MTLFSPPARSKKKALRRDPNFVAACDDLFERMSVHQLHCQEVGDDDFLDAVHGHNIWVIQTGENPGRPASFANSSGSVLMAISRPSLVSRARQTSPIPLLPRGDRILY